MSKENLADRNGVLRHALANAMTNQAWSIRPNMLEHLQYLVTDKHASLALEGSQPIAATTLLPSLSKPSKQVALLRLHGVIFSHAPEWAEAYGYISPQRFGAEIRKLADDPTVSSIVIDCESPGGTVAGTVEAAEAIAYAKSRKRVIGVVGGSCCSAAYWLLSQASEIVVTPTAMTGSIGVIITHADYSKMLSGLGVLVNYIRSATKKALGQPYEPLSEEARREFQATVDNIHAQFVAAVAKGRRKARAVVADTWATGEVWVGADAVTLGLADRVGSLQTVLGEQTGAIEAPAPTPPPPAPEEEPEDPDDDDLEARASPPAAAQQLPTEDPPATAQAGSSIDPQTALTAQEKTPVNIKDILAKVESGQKLTAEERTALDKHLDAQGNGAPAAAVDLSQLSGDARALVEKAQADAAAARADAERAQATANSERDARLNREFSEKAVALGQPAAFGATLRAASEKLSAEEYQALEQSLNASSAQESLLEETGTTKARRDSGNVTADYNARVDAHVKAHPGTNRADAGRAVLASDPEFAKRYRGG